MFSLTVSTLVQLSAKHQPRSSLATTTIVQQRQKQVCYHSRSHNNSNHVKRTIHLNGKSKLMIVSYDLPSSTFLLTTGSSKERNDQNCILLSKNTNTSINVHQRRTINTSSTGGTNITDRTSTSYLTADEKRAIFLKQSKELHKSMESMFGESNNARETISYAQRQQNYYLQQKGGRNQSYDGHDEEFKDKKKNYWYNSSIVWNIGLSFVFVVLAGQNAKTSFNKRNLQTKLDAALEVLETKRTLLQAVQDDNQLRTITKQIVRQIQQQQQTDDPNFHHNNQSIISSKRNQGSFKSVWGWLVGTGTFDNTQLGTDVYDSDEITNQTTAFIIPLTSLEEKVYIILSNHVKQIVGDGAYTDDEKDKNTLQQMMTTTADANTNNKNKKDNGLNDLMNELFKEQNNNKDEEKDNGSSTGAKVVKRRLFQI